MKQIRQSVFETNSSSTHSITLLQNGQFDDEWREDHTYTTSKGEVVKDSGYNVEEFTPYVSSSYLDPNTHTYYLRGGQFGWGWFLLEDFRSKLDYIYVLMQTFCDEKPHGEWIKELADKCKKKYPDYRKTLTDMVQKYYKDDEIQVIFNIFNNTDWIYIDHESQYVDMILFNPKWDLEEILFNPNIVITGGNDND